MSHTHTHDHALRRRWFLAEAGAENSVTAEDAKPLAQSALTDASELAVEAECSAAVEDSAESNVRPLLDALAFAFVQTTAANAL